METLFGVPVQQLMWILVAVFGFGTLVLGVSALRNRVAFKMAVRNVPRRRTQSVLIVFGLMLATMLFSASFTVGDTLTNSIRTQALEFIGETDVLVRSEAQENAAGPGGPGPVAGTGYFDAGVADSVRNRLDDERIGGVAPLVTETVPLVSEDTDLSEPAVETLGIESGAMEGFDEISTASGSTLSVDDLADDEVYVSAATADRLDAEKDDTIQAFLGEQPTELTVAGVYESGANPAAETSMVMPLQRLQELTGNEGRINAVIITHEGPAVEGAAGTNRTTDAIGPVLAANNLEADPIKRETLDQADELGTGFASIFLIIAQFSVAAGILLIFLIFVMLAAERKRELGIARGVGMQRGHLVRMFTFEGTLYALVASALGSLLGVGVGWVMVRVLGQAFAQFGDDLAFEIAFAANPVNVVIAFTLGMVLTFLVVLVSAWRVSRMNVVRAIRDIPEPDKKGRTVWGVLLAIITPLIGAVLTWQGLANDEMGLYLGGLSLLFVGVALSARIFRVPDRVAFTLAGLAILAVWLFPWEFFIPESMPEGGIEMFFVSGVAIVIAGVWVVIYNADLLLAAVVAVFGRIKGLPPVLKTAVNYPLQSRFRTGMTLAMFSLVVFTLVFVSFNNASFAALNEDTNRLSGGFEVRADAGSLAPIPDVQEAISNNEEVDAGSFAATATLSGLPAEAKQSDTGREPVDLFLQGVDEGYTRNVGYDFALTAPGYDSPEEVWTALREEPDTAVISYFLAPSEAGGVNFGDGQLELSGFFVEDEELPRDLFIEVEEPGTGEVRELRVIGVAEDTAYYPFTFGGEVVTSQATVDDLAGGPVPAQSYLFDLEEGVGAAATARKLESGFVANGLQTTVLAEEIESQNAVNDIIQNLFTGFLALGLLVGIAALGVIAARSVVERRQQIGVLRAIGFQRGQVRLAFLLESSFIALTGITLGVVLGSALAYGFITSFSEEGLSSLPFRVPWATLAVVVGLSYAAALLTTYLPARQASRVYPAEALRYEE